MRELSHKVIPITEAPEDASASPDWWTLIAALLAFAVVHAGLVPSMPW